MNDIEGFQTKWWKAAIYMIPLNMIAINSIGTIRIGSGKNLGSETNYFIVSRKTQSGPASGRHKRNYFWHFTYFIDMHGQEHNL